MKICHVLWSLSLGGIETMVSNIANEQAFLENEVAVFVINDLIDDTILAEFDQAVKVFLIGRPKGSKNPYYLFKLNYLIRKFRPDVIHFHQPDQRRLVFKSLIKKECTTLHTDCLPEFHKIIPKTPNLCVISRHVFNDVIAKTGVQPKVITNGISPERFAQRNEWFDRSRPFRILQLGRVWFRIKSQDILIKALDILRSRDINFTCDIIGEGQDLDGLKNMVGELKLDSVVKVLGAKDRNFIRNHISDYDLLVHPSRYEGFGLVITEGMASKVPVLVSDIESQLDIIGNGQFGYSFKNNDAASLADSIEHIINNYNLDLIERAFRRAWQFDIKNTARRYLDFYHRL